MHDRDRSRYGARGIHEYRLSGIELRSFIMGIVLGADIAAVLVCTAAISGSQEGEGKCFADIVERKYQRADSSA